MTIQARVEYLAKALRNHSENGLKEALKEISWPQPFPNAANEKQQVISQFVMVVYAVIYYQICK